MIEEQRGIEAHLQTFYQSLKKQATQKGPPLDTLQSIASLEAILSEKQEKVEEQLRAQELINSVTTLTLTELQELEVYREEHKENEKMIRMLEISQQIDVKLVQYEDSIVVGEHLQGFEGRMKIFRELYALIHLFNDQLNENMNGEEEAGRRLKVEYFGRVKKKIYKAMVDEYYHINANGQHLEQALIYFELPLKPKSSKQNEQQQEAMKRSSSPLNTTNMHHSTVITESLFTEYCCYCLFRKIELIIDEEQEKGMIENGEMRFHSTFFSKLWHKINKSVMYIFINGQQEREEGSNSAYKVDEPAWMFDYLQSAFSLNVRFIEDHIIKVVCGKNKEIGECIKTYIVSYNCKEYFANLIIERLNADIQYIREEQISNQDFICFNFLEQLHILESKIEALYDFEVSFIQPVLLWGDQMRKKLRKDYKLNKLSDKGDNAKKKSNEKNKSKSKNNSDNIPKQQLQLQESYNILGRNFDYEHSWFEERIFNDFYNINYSNSVDVRNIEAYNIVVNFIQLFEKMYAKFRKIQPAIVQEKQGDEDFGVGKPIKERINDFYYDCIIRLVRHVKTSFVRIYNNLSADESTAKKYEVLMGYKKVEDEFKGYFLNFIQASPQMQQKIQSQYFDSLEHFTMLYALEQLTPIHKKVYKRLTQFIDIYFNELETSAEEVDDEKEKDRAKDIYKWNKIFVEWTEAMDRITRIKMFYKDEKFRNIFFVFMESTQFSQKGFAFFIDLFEPFLLRIFQLQGLKVIKMLLQMEKGTLKQYIKSHQSILTFLHSSELRSIEKIDKSLGTEVQKQGSMLRGLVSRKK